jgi:hypothetical protein
MSGYLELAKKFVEETPPKAPEAALTERRDRRLEERILGKFSHPGRRLLSRGTGSAPVTKTRGCPRGVIYPGGIPRGRVVADA